MAKTSIVRGGTISSLPVLFTQTAKQTINVRGTLFNSPSTTPVGTWASTEATDTMVALGSSGVAGPFNVTEQPDHAAFVGANSIIWHSTEAPDVWSTSPGFTRLGVENPVVGVGSSLHLSTNGPDRILVFLVTGVIVSNPPATVASIVGTGPVGSTLTFRCEDRMIAGYDESSGVSNMEIWWAYAHDKIDNELFNVSYGAGSLTGGTVHAFAVKGLNGNYNSPWQTENPFAWGSGMGAFYFSTFGPTAIQSFFPVATGPLGSTGQTRSPITFDASTLQAATLDGTKLVVTGNGAGSPDNWAAPLPTATRYSGIVYYEVRFNNIAGSKYGTGVLFANTQGGPHGLVNNGSGGIICRGDGTIWVAGTQVGTLGVTPANNDVIGIALNFDTSKAWFKDITQSGSWNNSGTADPKYGVGGLSFTAAGLGDTEHGPASSASGAGYALPYAFTDGTSASAQQSYNFGGSAFVGAPPAAGWGGWTTAAASGTYGHVPYPSIVIGFQMSVTGISFGATAPPMGYSQITAEQSTGSQRKLAVLSYAKVCAENILLTDNDFQVGPAAPRWTMMFDTLVAGAANPGSWESIETQDGFATRGYIGSFSGYVGDLTSTEAKDTMTFLGFQRDSGIFVTREAPDIFSAYGAQPLTGTFVVTEATDRFSAAGLGQGENGVWISTEASDVFAALGYAPISGPFNTTEAADKFFAIGAGVTQVRRRRTLFVT